jgi:hypothetical protein
VRQAERGAAALGCISDFKPSNLVYMHTKHIREWAWQLCYSLVEPYCHTVLSSTGGGRNVLRQLFQASIIRLLI